MPKPSWPAAKPTKYAASVRLGVDGPNSRAIAAKAGRYISTDTGPTAMRKPKTSASRRLGSRACASRASAMVAALSHKPKHGEAAEFFRKLGGPDEFGAEDRALFDREACREGFRHVNDARGRHRLDPRRAADIDAKAAGTSGERVGDVEGRAVMGADPDRKMIRQATFLVWLRAQRTAKFHRRSGSHLDLVISEKNRVPPSLDHCGTDGESANPLGHRRPDLVMECGKVVVLDAAEADDIAEHHGARPSSPSGRLLGVRRGIGAQRRLGSRDGRHGNGVLLDPERFSEPVIGGGSSD